MNLLNEFVFIHKLHTLYQILIHESSLRQGWLVNQDLIERVELVDEDIFVEQILAASCLILL